MDVTAVKNKKRKSMELLAGRILEIIITDKLPLNSHLKETQFANRLKVSRTPVRSAFIYLQEQGYLVKKPNQGFFVAKKPESKSVSSINNKSIESNGLSTLCYQIGQDYLNGRIEKSVTENELISRYELGRKNLQEALIAMEKEGWLNRNIGYGWEFNKFISSPSAYAQSYRFRQLIEPEALRDKSFQVDDTKIQMLRMSQIDILNNNDKLVSAAEMFNAGVLFHETLVSMSGNIFLLDSLQRVNRLRRLIEYNVNSKRSIPKKECEEHLYLIELIQQNELEKAADFLSKHLERAALEKEQIAQALFA